MQVDMPFIKNLFTPLTKYVVIPLGLIAARSEADAGIHQRKS